MRRLRERLAADRRLDQGRRAGLVHAIVDDVVHGHRGSQIAAAQAGHVLDVHVLALEASAERLAQRVASVTVARHVAAHPHLRPGRGLQKKMRVEARDRLEAIKRNVEAIGERAQLPFGQVPVCSLDCAKVIEDRRMRGGPIHAREL